MLHCYAEASHSITQSQLSHHKKVSSSEHKELKERWVKKINEHDKMKCKHEKLRLATKENMKTCSIHKRMHEEEQSKNYKLCSEPNT